MRVTALGATLFAFWLLLSGLYTPFLVLAGLGTSLAVAALAWRMGAADSEGYPVELTLAAVTYWPWLVREIIVSGWQVSRIVLHPRLPVSPRLVRFKPSQRTPVGLVTHANSITLTPGTLTVEAEQESFLVHTLTRTGAAGLEGSEMDRRVSRLEGKA
ncbi:MAG: Na+/H+ antiporter subunit E [Betaproteobacteria bacterium]